MKTHFSSITLFIAMALLCQTPQARCGPAPEPAVGAALSNSASAPDGFFPCQWAVIDTDVVGDIHQGPTVTAKVDIVFLLDESGSMESTDDAQVRRTTIIQILSELNPDQYRAAIVVFNDEAGILGGYPSLTTDFGSLISCVQDLPDPGGYTNMAGAMELANSLLSESGANHRLAILLTDGTPESESSMGYDVAQDAVINTIHVPFAIAADINYYVVHLAPGAASPAGLTLLQDRIARDTGGQYLPVESADQLATVLPDIVQEVSTTLVLKDVYLDVQFRFGPHEYSAVDADRIVLLGADSYEMPAEGQVITAKRRTLPAGQGISVKIPVTSYMPIPPGSPPDLTHVTLPVFTSEAVVRYHLGDGQPRSRQINQVYVTWRRAPQVLVYKEIDPGNRRLTISVTNFYASAIRNVRLLDLLTGNLEADCSTFVPEPKYVFTYEDNMRPLDQLYWELGDVAPFTPKTVSFHFRYSGPSEGPIYTDLVKPPSQVYYTAADGSEHVISADSRSADLMWYGDTVIEAGLLNPAPTETTGPDVVLYSSHSGDPRAEVPAPHSNSIWNDSLADGGYNAEAIDAEHATSEPLDLYGKNKLWVRINNQGNAPLAGETQASVYISPAYTASVQDLDPSNWTFIDTFDLGSLSVGSGSFVVKGLEWNPTDVLSAAYRNSLSSAGYAYFRVVVTFDGSERRLNNNAAVKRVRVP
jgi:Mg-chelatase subunit ChlD